MVAAYLKLVRPHLESMSLSTVQQKILCEVRGGEVKAIARTLRKRNNSFDEPLSP